MNITEMHSVYFPALEISGPLATRIDAIYNILKKICPDSIEDIFISEFRPPEGQRSYQSLFFFSPGYMLEAKQFLGQDSFDITPLKKGVYYFEIQASGYDFERASDSSNLKVTAIFNQSVQGLLQASGTNCNYLKDIIHKYLKANLVGD